MPAGRPLSAAALAAALLASAPLARSQTIEDHVFMSKGKLCTGFVYGHDRWDEYWEGELKRENLNVGTVTTKTLGWMGTYGVTDRLNVIAMAPYVWTTASGGTLHGQSGLQDLTVAAKWNALEVPFTSLGSLRTVAVVSAGTPLTDYVPDLLPLSIGVNSKRVSTRLTLSFQAKKGIFVNATGAYTWRGKLTLDRPAYFTDGQLFLTDQVALPDVVDLEFSAGYFSPRFHLPISFAQQITRGGGDIRRQDMPFPSNRMNASRVNAMAMYYLPMNRNLALKASGSRAVSGRNVGQSTMLTAGVMYTFNF
jgi:Putative MetA-pathway of phenol degradation